MSRGAHNFVADSHSALVSGLGGLLELNPSLHFDQKHRVVYRNDSARVERVTILSGGGSGHEPAHAGFVGSGMLDAAVCGAVLASPNTQQIDKGLQTIHSPKGIVVIIKNYAGDKLNFTLAVDRFRLVSSVPVRTVVVADDVSIGRSRSALVGRRGIAGTLLIHKIAGGASAAGLDIDSVASACEFASANMGSIGVGLDGCHIPGQVSKSRLAEDEVEIGIGIHNEPGSRRISPRPALDTLIKEIVGHILKDDPERNYLQSPPRPGQHDLVLLVNNLSGLSVLETLAITNDVISHLNTEYGLKPSRVYSGTLLSALDCPGFRVTLLSLPKHEPLSSQILEWLDSPTNAIGWPSLLPPPAWNLDASTNNQKGTETISSIDIVREIPSVPCNGRLLQSILRSIHESVVVSEPDITRNDTILGDGDCGTTLLDGTTSLVKAMQDGDINTESLSHAILKIADLISLSMGGTSGALYAVFMTAFASGLARATDVENIDVDYISNALKQGLSSLEQVTAAREGDRTLMDALIPFVNSFAVGTDRSADEPLNVLETAFLASKQGCEATATLESRFGRSAYVGVEDKQDASTSIPDPGAMGVVAILSGVRQAVEQYYKST